MRKREQTACSRGKADDRWANCMTVRGKVHDVEIGKVWQKEQGGEA